ncbi:anti-sigma factor [Nonomuraea sp. NPDC050783]|uniref:anti-sigma factor family protein n=1 Tax=Nonomuraea sp. NPDC050783 TaxID=3154634 RepID=UPI00346717F4
MTCEEVRISLGAHALGALDPEEALEIDHHLATCEVCGTELLELEGVASFLDKVSERDVELVASPPRQVLDRLLDDRVKRTRRGRLLLVAAASVVALALGGVAWTALDDGGPRQTAASAPERAASPAAPSAESYAARSSTSESSTGESSTSESSTSESSTGESSDTATEQPGTLADRSALPTPTGSQAPKKAVAGPEFRGENEEADYYATVMAWPDAAGTELAVQLHGVPTGTTCHLRVVGAGGRRDVTDSWVVGDAAYQKQNAFKTGTGLRLKDIVRFDVVNERTGKVLVRVKVPGK